MKKILLFLTVIAVFVGCKKDAPQEKIITISDYGYNWDFCVDNQITSDLVLTYPNPTETDATRTIIVEAGGTEKVSGLWTLGGKSEAKLEDNLSDDFRIDSFVLGYGYPFTMTIDGKTVSDDVWVKKHWSFESDYYTRTYTLTVTDELLDSLE